MCVCVCAVRDAQCFYGDTSSVAGVPSSGGLLVGARLGLKAIRAVPQVECLLHGRQDVIKGAPSVCVCVRVCKFPPCPMADVWALTVQLHV